MQMMRLGVLIDDRQPFYVWQERFLEEIGRQDNLDLCVLINHNLPALNGNLATRIAALQQWIENCILPIDRNYLPGKVTDSKHARNLDLAHLDSNGGSNEHGRAIEQIRSYDLDLIIDLTCSIVHDDLLHLAKGGVWTLQHGSNHYHIGHLAGFTELLSSRPVIPIRLIQINHTGQARLLEESHHFVHWSLAKNGAQLVEQASVLLLKHLNLQTHIPGASPSIHSLDEPIGPSTGQVLRYLIYFYRTLITKACQKLAMKLWGRRFRCWSILMGSGQFASADLNDLHLLKPPPGEFWADPFLYEDHEKTYLFFENFSYRDQIGKISCGEVSKGSISKVKDVLVKSYHLSYPFLFEEDGYLYMIPETSANKRLEIYRCKNLPDEWELFTTAFEGEAVADTTYFRDEDGKRWLFMNKGTGGYYNSQLHIYQIDSLSLDKIIPHRQNPVVVDARQARNAGAIFWHNGHYIRPSQNNSFGVYGYGLNMNAIKQLSLDQYEEELLWQVTPNSNPELRSCHHLHQSGNKFVIDEILT